MKNLIDLFVNENKGGLLLVNFPVGYGKTTAAISHVAAQLLAEDEENSNRYIITTPIKKNLSHKKLLDIIEWKYRDKVLFLDSNVDSIIHHFDEELSELPGN